MGQCPAYEVVSSPAQVTRLCSLQGSTNSAHTHRALPTEMASEEEVRASSSLHRDSRAEDVHSGYQLRQDFSRLQSAPSAQHFGSDFHGIHSVVPPSEVAWRTSPRIRARVTQLCGSLVHPWPARAPGAAPLLQQGAAIVATLLQLKEAWPALVSPRVIHASGWVTRRPLRALRKIGTLLCDI